MDKKKLYSVTALYVKDDIKLLDSADREYDTSSCDLKSANEKREPTEFLSCRRILSTMMFLGFVVAYSLRISLSEAIVAMVNQTGTSGDAVTANTSYQCVRDPQEHGSGEFTWDRHQQGIVLAAFYYGYILTQVFGGWLSDRVGGKWTFGGGILGCAVLTLLTPSAAYLHWLAVVAVRFFEGMLEGFMLPSVHALLARWTPATRTTRGVTAAFSGQEFGIVVGMLLGGVLSDHGFAGGWPSVFYVFGMTGCIWFAVWVFLCYNSPSTHPRISTAELEYLEAVTCKIDNSAKRPRTPWRKIFSSRPLLSCCLAKFAHNWGYHTLASGLPMFYFDVLGFNMTNNGLLASLPFLAAGIMLLVAGYSADWLRAPGRLTTTTVRKVFMSCGLLLPSVLFILSGFVDCTLRAVVVVMIVLAMGCAAFAWSCVTVNSLDLSSTHAATLLGITNSSGTLAALAAPHVIGALTYNASTHAQWRKVFYITAAIEWIGTIVYSMFGSGEPQNW